MGTVQSAPQAYGALHPFMSIVAHPLLGFPLQPSELAQLIELAAHGVHLRLQIGQACSSWLPHLVDELRQRAGIQPLLTGHR